MTNTHSTSVLRLVEVLGFAAQGISRPLLCRAEDGDLYFVKGQQTNRSSLWAEWICAHLARALGLPLPPFSLVQLDGALLPELPTDWRPLGCLPAFGSRRHPQACWLESGQAGRVPVALQRDLLAFDWWVRNSDRNQGNTNLLWDPGAGELVVIDHNNAFDPSFDPQQFLEHHVFADQWQALTADLVTSAEVGLRLQQALPAARLAIDTAPAEWAWENSELDAPTRFDPEAALATLARCATPDLWRTT